MNKEPSLSKKASKRFTYPIAATVEVNSTRQPTQIQNISKTGIQFASNFPIANNARIHIAWQDAKLGLVESHIMVVRNISHQKVEGYDYCYGSKFMNARFDLKRNVNRLVETVQAQHRQNDEKMLGKVSFKIFEDIITHDKVFLRKLVEGGKSFFRLIDRYAHELTKYEKQAFKHDDMQSQWIQSLITEYFHCRILSAALTVMDLKELKTSEASRVISKKLHAVPMIIQKFEKFRGSIDMPKNSQAFRESQETLRRLIYSHQELLETFIKLGRLETRTH